MLAMYGSVLIALTIVELSEFIAKQESLSEDLDEIIAIFLVMLVTLPVGLLVAWQIAGNLLRPLTAMLATAERIRRGNLDERIPLIEDNELAKLGETINEAFDQYGLAVRRLEKFSADASHQLRTPIAAIRTSAEVTLREERETEDYRESLVEILEQTERLNQTVDQLLLLARMNESLREQFKPVPIIERLNVWTAEAADMIESRRIWCECDEACAGRMLNGSEILLRQCFDNIINNAVAATGEDGQILVRIDVPTAGKITVSIEDNGPGIPEPERSPVFDRFYRGKNTRTPGSGLGLAIAKEIITLHGGTIRAGSSERLCGAAFVLSF